MGTVATPESAGVSPVEAAAPASAPHVEHAVETDEELVEAVVHAAPDVLTRAEHRMYRSVVVGIAIGIPVCALVWMGISALAVGIAGYHVSWPGLLAMGATVGVFAGCFFGGWAGITLSAEQLEKAEIAAEEEAEHHHRA